MIAAHPGHEFSVLGWVRASRPPVAVLTDGSGSGEAGRIELTDDVLDAAGCPRATVYGEFTDKRVYEAILGGDASLFLGVAQRLADWLVQERIDLVASDAAEGYNPTHDLCAAIAGRATRLAAQASGRTVEHYTFPLLGAPSPENPPPEALSLQLDPSGLADKLAEVRRYAALAGGALVDEIELIFKEYGEAAFARENFLPANLPEAFAAFGRKAPFYEAYGEKHVAAGRFSEVIRFRNHIEPLVNALAN